MKRTFLLAGAVVFGMALLVFVGRHAPSRTTQSVYPSTFNTGLRGAAAAYEFLGRLGYPQVRWGASFASLGRTEGVLVLAAPFRQAVSESDARALRRWISGGGTCLYLRGPTALAGEAQRELDRVFGLTARDSRGLLESALDHLVQATAVPAISVPHRYALRAPRIAVEANAELPHSEEAFLPLYHIDQRPVAGVRTIGAGRLILVASALPISRAALASADNADFLLAVVEAHRGSGVVIWDEYHHGFRERYPLADLVLRPEISAVLLQVFVLGLIYVWSRGLRYGVPLVRLDPERRSVREFVCSLSDLYRRARQEREVLATLVQRHRRALAAYLQLPPNASLDDISAHLRQHGGTPAAELCGMLHRAQAVAESTRVSRRVLVQQARALQRIVAVLRKETW